MNKLANVIYAYTPKNDDELELAVGDKIEVIGYEEEGWWKGKLKGRIGVFPSNFVEVVESVSSSTQQQQQQVTNKLNSIFGSKVTSKNSISSNSLNTLNNNSGTNSLNNNNSSSNNNLIMNNTQSEIDSTNTNEYPFASAAAAEESLNSSASSNEKRPKPIRGNGFGDIFAAGAKLKPLPADPSKPPPPVTAMASERLSTINNLTSTLQKPIPKKPPPPAPANDTIANGSLPDQAPALPPKPSNQLSPFLQQQQQASSRPLPPTTQHSQASIAQVREQVRVIYAYKSSIPDELTIEVGDIINVIDKNIEDVGWWKGELNGKIGVFPDNFVRPITLPDIPAQNSQQQQDWNTSGGSRTSSASHQSALAGGGFTTQSQQQHSIAAAAATANTTENKMKSVFAGTPKGFSKELENNLEKHGNQALFLSLKRNKLQQQAVVSGGSIGGVDSIAQATTTTTSEMNNPKRETETGGSQESSPTKLNHITANRAKGPSRRPPSSILNKRNQIASDFKQRETNGRADEPTLCSLPANSNPLQKQTNHDTLSSLPFGPNKGSTTSGIANSAAHEAAAAALAATLQSNPNPLSHPSADKETPQQVALGGSKQAINNNPRSNPLPALQLPDKSMTSTAPSTATTNTATTNATATSSPPTRPPWMVELRKSNLEKKRDTTALNHDDDTPPTPVTPSVISSKNVVEPMSAPTSNNNPSHSERPKAASPERKNSIHSLKETYNPPVNSVKSISSRYTAGDLNALTNQQSITSETPNRTSLLNSNNNPQESAPSHHAQETISQSPVTNRVVSTLFGNGQQQSKHHNNIAPLSSSITKENGNSGNSNNNNHNVPSNENNKFLGSVSNNVTTVPKINQSNNIDTSNQPAATVPPPATGIQRSPQAVIGKTGTNASDRQSITDNNNDTKFVMSKAQYDNLLKQISNNVNTEIGELRIEVKKLQEEFKGIHELKAVIETMKLELTACQSATENQKRYIRELVNNLADERKKIAAMQGELEKNFK